MSRFRPLVASALTVALIPLGFGVGSAGGTGTSPTLTAATGGSKASAISSRSVSRAARLADPRPRHYTLRNIVVIDGDTIKATVVQTGRREIIRLAGMQTMEKEECWYAEGTRALRHALGRSGRFTTLYDSRERHAPTGDMRLLGNVFTPSGGDVQQRLIRQGVALSYPLGRETLRQDSYAWASAQAAHERVGMYGGHHCGPRRALTPHLAITIHYDGNGADARDWSDRTITITNNDPTQPADLSRWRLRTAAHVSFYLPDATVVPPGGQQVIRLGPARSPGELSWTGAIQRLPVPGKSKYHYGGAYLFDPAGNLHAWRHYPCLIDCSHPAQGLVRVRVEHSPDGPDTSRTEYVELSSQAPVDVSGLVVEVRTMVLALPPGTWLSPGDPLYLHAGTEPSQGRHLSLGLDRRFPAPPHVGRVRVRTHDTIPIACWSWGRDPC